VILFNNKATATLSFLYSPVSHFQTNRWHGAREILVQCTG